MLRSIFPHYFTEPNSAGHLIYAVGRAIALAVSRWLASAAARVQTRV
jgi:hypothetical protein